MKLLRDSTGRFVKGNVPPNKGKHLSEETKERLRKEALRPENIRISIQNLGKYIKGIMGKDNPNWKGGVTFHKCEVCAKIFRSCSRQAKYCSESCYYEALKERNAGKENPNWKGGITFHKCTFCGKEFRGSQTAKYCSLSCKARDEGFFVKLNQDLDFQRRRAKALKGRKLSEKHLRNLLRATHATPNKLESRVIGIIRRWSLPFKFVGDGSVIINGLNPDFTHKHKRKLIEVFGRAFHDPTYGLRQCIPWYQQYFGRKAIFSQLGYETLILWDDELEMLSDEQIGERIKNF